MREQGSEPSVVVLAVLVVARELVRVEPVVARELELVQALFILNLMKLGLLIHLV